MSNKKAWILTTEVNEYNQEGAYFVAWFSEKPTAKQVAECLGQYSSFDLVIDAQWVIDTGGGRQGTEYRWFNLMEKEEGA